MSNQSMINFQDAISPLMEELVYFHDHTLLFLLLILMSIGFLLWSVITNKILDMDVMSHELLETVWTILPGMILAVVAFPSLEVLYLSDDAVDPSISVKAVGHQWYWSYEYSDFPEVYFDSYHSVFEDESNFNFLEVDSSVVLPIGTNVRLVSTSTDVIHSWALPVVGVKVDAVPGRLNQAHFLPLHMGSYYGMCSEMCGAMHSFMPINMEIVDVESFMHWVYSYNVG